MSSSLGRLPIDSTIAERGELPVNGSGRESDSEAETIVLPSSTPRNGDSRPSNGEGHKEDREKSSEDSDDVLDVGRQIRRHRNRREIDPYSSELSSVPPSPQELIRLNIANESTGGQNPSPRRSRKRKAPMEIEHEVGNGKSKDSSSSPQRKKSRSPSDHSPYPRQPSPSNSTRNRAVQIPSSKGSNKVAKPRKTPAPLRPSKRSEELSPSVSRQCSPAGVTVFPRPPATRTPASPVHMNLPHKPKRDSSGRTMLHRAAHKGSLEDCIKLLCQDPDLLNAEDNAGYIALHEASLLGHTEVVRFLLKKGAWVDQQSRDELDTPLMDAAENSHLEVVRILLEAGADPRRRNKSGSTALECLDTDHPDSRAIEEALTTALQKIRSKRVSDDECRGSAPIDSHSSRDPSVTSPLHDSPPATARSTTGRRRNARADQTKNEMLWVEGGKNGLQKLREKARLGDTEIVYACLERGVRPDVESLIAAIKGGHDDTVSLLLAFGADADPKPIKCSKSGGNRNKVSEETPMLAAIGRNNLKILEYLLDKVDPLRLDSRGKSYAEIARERAGDSWEAEVKVLQDAWDKAKAKSKGNTKSAPKLEKPPTAMRKPLDMPGKKRSRPHRESLTTAKQPESTPSIRDESDTDSESPVEIVSRKKDRRLDASSNLPSSKKKKRRLVSGKDLIAEKPGSEHSTAKMQPKRLTSETPSNNRLNKASVTEMSNTNVGNLPHTRSSHLSHERKLDKSKSEKKKLMPSQDTEREKSDRKLSKSAPNDGEKKRRRLERRSAKGTETTPIKTEIDIGESMSKRVKLEKEEIIHVGGDLDSDSDIAVKESSGEEKDKCMAPDSNEQKKPIVEELADSSIAVDIVAKQDSGGQHTVDSEGRLEGDRSEAETDLALVAAAPSDEQILYSENSVGDRPGNIKLEDDDDTLCQETIENEQREREDEEKALAEAKRVEEEQRRVAEESRIAEQKLKEQEERQRLLEEEEKKRVEAEEARARAIAEEKLQQEMKVAEERRRLEEAELQRQFEAQERERKRLEDEAAERKRLEEEAAEKKRIEEEAAERKRIEEEAAEKKRIEEEEAQRKEIIRRESLPYPLKLAAENETTEFSLETATRWLPFISDGLEHKKVALGLSQDSDPKPREWILNIQVALVLQTNDLSLSGFNFEKRELTEHHKTRIWGVWKQELCAPITLESTSAEISHDQHINEQKFFHMEPLFWVKFEDFYQLIKVDPRFASLYASSAVSTTWIDIEYPHYTIKPEIGHGPIVSQYRESHYKSLDSL